MKSNTDIRDCMELKTMLKDCGFKSNVYKKILKEISLLEYNSDEDWCLDIASYITDKISYRDFCLWASKNEEGIDDYILNCQNCNLQNEMIHPNDYIEVIKGAYSRELAIVLIESIGYINEILEERLKESA